MGKPAASTRSTAFLRQEKNRQHHLVPPDPVPVLVLVPAPGGWALAKRWCREGDGFVKTDAPVLTGSSHCSGSGRVGLRHPHRRWAGGCCNVSYRQFLFSFLFKEKKKYLNVCITRIL